MWFFHKLCLKWCGFIAKNHRYGQAFYRKRIIKFELYIKTKNGIWKAVIKAELWIYQSPVEMRRNLIGQEAENQEAFLKKTNVLYFNHTGEKG